jgi:hypothetical protein
VLRVTRAHAVRERRSALQLLRISPRPPSAGRSRLASPPALHPRQSGDAFPLGHRGWSVPGPRPSGQPPAEPQMGAVRGPAQTSGHRRRRRRPQTGRLVLVPRRRGPAGATMDG